MHILIVGRAVTTSCALMSALAPRFTSVRSSQAEPFWRGESASQKENSRYGGRQLPSPLEVRRTGRGVAVRCLRD
jgi:hypothetical protein